jgi:hypothetical protein
MVRVFDRQSTGAADAEFLEKIRFVSRLLRGFVVSRGDRVRRRQ